MNDRSIKIRYVPVHEHNKLVLIDRFVKTLREKINKYFVKFNTTKYIDVLPELVESYNDSYHSTIKMKPCEVRENEPKITALFNKKYNDALHEEQKLNINDEVRYIINKAAFAKGTLPRWSKSIHKILSSTEHTYTLDNNKTYKYYELQKISAVYSLNIPQKEKTIEEINKENKNKRRFKKSGLNVKDILKF